METWVENFSDQLPIYMQIVQQFKARVATGALAKGERLPSIRDLSITLRVNPNTVMRAYQELERGGLIKSQRGLGFFVTEEDIMDKVLRELACSAAQRFADEMRHIGLDEEEMLRFLQEYLKERGRATHEQLD